MAHHMEAIFFKLRCEFLHRAVVHSNHLVAVHAGSIMPMLKTIKCINRYVFVYKKLQYPIDGRQPDSFSVFCDLRANIGCAQRLFGILKYRENTFALLGFPYPDRPDILYLFQRLSSHVFIRIYGQSRIYLLDLICNCILFASNSL